MSMSAKAERSVLALSQTLRAARLNCGDSQAAAAARIGVGNRSYQRMESASPVDAGRVAVGDFLMALDVYGVDVLNAIALATKSSAVPSQRYGRTPARLPATQALAVFSPLRGDL